MFCYSFQNLLGESPGIIFACRMFLNVLSEVLLHTDN